MVAVKALYQQGRGEVWHCPETAHHAWHTRQEETCRNADVFLGAAFHHIADPCFTHGERDYSCCRQIDRASLQLSQGETTICEFEAGCRWIVPVVAAMAGKMEIGASLHCCKHALFRPGLPLVKGMFCEEFSNGSSFWFSKGQLRIGLGINNGVEFWLY